MKIKKVYSFIMIVFIILFSIFIGLFVIGNVAQSKEYMYLSCCHGVPCHGIYYSNKDNLCHFIECEKDNTTFRSFGYGSNCTFIPTNLTAIN